MKNLPPPAVLLVDDDQGICSSLSRILRKDGYRVDLAHSAGEALARSNWGDYFAILLDRKLPDGNIDSLLPEIVGNATDAAVLVITAYADLDGSLAAIRAGAADYLLKPVDPETLRGRLKLLWGLKRAEAEVRKRDEQVQFMIDHLPAGAAYVDDMTGEVRVNASIERLTGFTAAELASVDAWFANVFGDDADHFRHVYDADRRAGFPERRTVLCRRKQGGRFRAEFSAYKYDEHEVWLIQDVTERLRMQNEIRQQRDFLDRILETAQVIILVLDPAGKIVRFNQFMRDLSGYELEEVLGENWFETFLPEREATKIQQLFARVANGEEVRGHVNPIRTRSGDERKIAWWGKALRGPDGAVTEVLSIGHDVTDLQDIQAKLVQSERMAAIGQMIAGLAHESRNALQRARACLDMLSLDLEDQPRQLDLTGRIQIALDELQRLYEEVRNYAAPVKLSLGRHDLADVWRTAWHHVLQTHDTSSISLDEQVQLADTMTVIDRHRLEQVFRNVLENAVAVAPAGSSVTLRCRGDQIDGQPAICVAISDTGPGLTPEQSQRIFEPFFTTKQKGTGLGMAISERIIEAHDGSIKVASGSRKGATIEIRLPTPQRQRPGVAAPPGDRLADPAAIQQEAP